MGYVLDAPASAPPKSSCVSAINVNTEKKNGGKIYGDHCFEVGNQMFANTRN